LPNGNLSFYGKRRLLGLHTLNLIEEWAEKYGFTISYEGLTNEDVQIGAAVKFIEGCCNKDFKFLNKYLEAHCSLAYRFKSVFCLRILFAVGWFKKIRAKIDYVFTRFVAEASQKFMVSVQALRDMARLRWLKKIRSPIERVVSADSPAESSSSRNLPERRSSAVSPRKNLSISIGECLESLRIKKERKYSLYSCSSSDDEDLPAKRNAYLKVFRDRLDEDRENGLEPAQDDMDYNKPLREAKEYLGQHDDSAAILHKAKAAAWKAALNL
jgi:hypothetical protein